MTNPLCPHCHKPVRVNFGAHFTLDNNVAIHRSCWNISYGIPHATRQRNAEQHAAASFQLLRRIANLNPACPTIGPGMLASLVSDARALLGEPE